MSKNKPKQQSQNSKYLIIAGVVIALIVAVGALVASRGTTSSAVQKISPTDYETQFAASTAPYLLVDVRTPDEFASGHIHNAINIPLDSIENRLSEFPQDQPVILYCHSGNRSSQAARILSDAGYTNIYDLGGINAWTAQGLPIE